MRFKTNKYLLASAALAGCMAASIGTAAFAADTWTGFYVGAHVGTTNGSATWSDIVVSSAPAQDLPGAFSNSQPSGGLIGIHAGYNRQLMGPMVIGIEGNVNVSPFSGGTKGSSTCFGNSNYGDYAAECTSEIKSTYDVAVRVGFSPVDKLLVYAKAGPAKAKTRFIPAGQIGPVSGSFYHPDTSTVSSHLIGFGIDMAVSDQWTVGAEYNSQDFGTKMSFQPSGNLNNYNPAFTAKADVRLNTLVMRVSRRY